jgi:hypothetical protein
MAYMKVVTKIHCLLPVPEQTAVGMRLICEESHRSDPKPINHLIVLHCKLQPEIG